MAEGPASVTDALVFRAKHMIFIVFKYTLEVMACWFSGKLWYLQHNCIGDTVVYH